MLKINGLKAEINGKEILKGLNLEVKPGEVHAIMGPNGSGKSTLASVLAGREEYEVTGGVVDFEGEDLLDLSPEQRAGEGLFLAFQYPVEIPGVSNINFIKTAVNEVREYRGLPNLETKEFMKLLKEKQQLVELSGKLANRSVNEGFSGGEKKRNEIFIKVRTTQPNLLLENLIRQSTSNHKFCSCWHPHIVATGRESFQNKI